ncbi:unnamed protein product [Phytophthora fragariaefolia]|uniref:Unnamed protein product n=1 Tax=Phytophthora fragariaefolia TaxID=1490495 RepID=A0A9W6WVV2_9STRA|nr:unnamed protein product [Phytophthora fragariaefolia]
MLWLEVRVHEKEDGAHAKERGACVELKECRLKSNSPSKRLGEGPELGVPGCVHPDAPVQASVGDAVKIEPPAADETSESSSPVQDVVTLEDANDESTRLTCKEEGPLPVVQEEPATYVPKSTEQPSLDVSTSSPATQLNVQTLSPESMAVHVSQMIIDLTGEALPNTPARSDGPTVAQVKTYVADQVRRWERVTTEFVASPTTEYSWPSPPPDFQTWWAAAMTTSEYIASRTAMASSEEAWISEWNLVCFKRGPCLGEIYACLKKCLKCLKVPKGLL